MDISWIWISCGHLIDNSQDVQWIENAVWEQLKEAIALLNTLSDQFLLYSLIYPNRMLPLQTNMLSE